MCDLDSEEEIAEVIKRVWKKIKLNGSNCPTEFDTSPPSTTNHLKKKKKKKKEEERRTTKQWLSPSIDVDSRKGQLSGCDGAHQLAIVLLPPVNS